MDFEKKQKLEAEGCAFDSELLCFVNRKTEKIFTSDWIDSRNLNTVQISISLPHNSSTWKLHLNPDQPHEEIRIIPFMKYGNTL